MLQQDGYDILYTIITNHIIDNATLPKFFTYSSAIVIVMRRNEANHEIQQFCCSALMNWVRIYWNIWVVPSCATVIEAIVTAM